VKGKDSVSRSVLVTQRIMGNQLEPNEEQRPGGLVLIFIYMIVIHRYRSRYDRNTPHTRHTHATHTRCLHVEEEPITWGLSSREDGQKRNQSQPSVSSSAPPPFMERCRNKSQNQDQNPRTRTGVPEPGPESLLVPSL